MKPTLKPANPNFSSGPCSKLPGYDVARLDTRSLGRSHRSAIGKELLGRACDDTAAVLGLPAGCRVGVVPAAESGAVGVGLRSLLRPGMSEVFDWASLCEDW